MSCKRIAIVLALAAAAGPGWAGRPCEPRIPEARRVEGALTLAERTARALDASGAKVVALARSGQDLSRWGLAWSHMGWAYREEQAGRPVWRVVHKLNACGTAHADVYRQGLAEFFLDDLHEHKAGYMVLRPEVQARLLPLLRDNARLAQLHTRDYNMVAYPWAQRYQQSNQWAIETLALASDERAGTRPQAQAWLRLQGYEPAVLHIDALSRLGARVGTANVAFDDHPNAKRFSDRIETASVDSVFAWLQRSSLAAAVQVVR